MNRKVYIVDLNAERAAKLQAFLEQNGGEVHHFPLLKDCLTAMKTERCRVLLIHHELLAGLDPPRGLFSLCKTVVYGESMDALDKEEWYARGAYRVVSTGVDLIYRTAQVVTKYWYRHDELLAFRQKKLTTGQVGLLPLRVIFYNAMSERKSLILRAGTDSWQARVQFYQGHLVDARTQEINGTAAALKMLHLSSGNFLLHRCCFEEPAEVHLPSILGLLAEQSLEEKRLFTLTSRLGMRNPRFVLSSRLQADALSPDQQVLLEALKQFPWLQALILRAPLPPLAILQQLKTFLDHGWIALEREGQEAGDWEEPDITYLQEVLFVGQKRESNLVVLGFPGSWKSQLMKTLCGRRNVQEKTIHSLQVARVTLREGMFLNIIGLTLQENFMQLMEKLSQNLAACIVLLPHPKNEDLEYIQYLLQQIVQQMSVPMVVGVTGGDQSPRPEQLVQLREALKLPEEIEIIPVCPRSFDSARQLIYNLNPVKGTG